jgi:hypothetical protein
MNMMWPSDNTNDNSVMNSLRVMLDSLEEDMIADRPKELDEPDGIVVEEVQFLEEGEEEEEVESLAQTAESDPAKAGSGSKFSGDEESQPTISKVGSSK